MDLRDPDRSGLARVAVSTVRAFLARHTDEFSVTLAGPTDTLEQLGARQWGARRIVSWPDGRYSLPADLHWPRVRAEAASDLWYFPHWDVPWRVGDTPFVVTLHDLAHVTQPELGAVKRFVARRWIARTLARARRVLAISEHSARELASVWPRHQAKVTLVPNGVDATFFAEPPPLPPDLRDTLGRDPVMLSVGIRKERKNLAVGIEVLRRAPELRWVVVGEWFPEWERVAARAAAAGVANRLIVIDRADDAVLRALYGRAAFLLFPSRYEGFGLPILEALASGTPVVAARTSSIPEVLGDAGWLCDPDDADAFAAAARDVLALGSRRAGVAERGRARARQFSWERSADGLAEALRASASRTAPARRP